MSAVLVTFGAFSALWLATRYIGRTNRLKSFRTEALTLSYEQASERYETCLQNVVTRLSDPTGAHSLRDKDIVRELEHATYFYERMIELETGHAGPAVRSAIRPKMLLACQSAVRPRSPCV